MKIGTQRIAQSPLQELEYRGENVSVPQPRFPVGSKVCQTGPQSSANALYFKNVMLNQLVEDTLKIVDKLRRQGLSTGNVGDPLPEFNRLKVAAIMDFMATADSVEVAGHAPQAMHAVGVIGNQCYLEEGPCHSGVSHRAFLLYRKIIDGNALVYIHPHAVIPENCLANVVELELTPDSVMTPKPRSMRRKQ